MNVDKFGLHVFKKRTKCNCIRPSLESIDDGDLDAKMKVIKNVGNPIDLTDCATKNYVDKAVNDIFKKIKSINQNVEQLENEINNLKQMTDVISSKIRKK